MCSILEQLSIRDVASFACTCTRNRAFVVHHHPRLAKGCFVNGIRRLLKARADTINAVHDTCRTCRTCWCAANPDEEWPADGDAGGCRCACTPRHRAVLRTERHGLSIGLCQT